MTFQPDSLYYGDCLDVMRQWPSACVDLCYLDPPFNSQANYNILFGRDSGRGLRGGGNLAQLVAFEDTWTWDGAAQNRVDEIERAIAHPAHKAIKGLRYVLGDCGMLAYLSYMAERLGEIRRVLKPDGSIYLHCDPTASHYLKAVMDDVFGSQYFRNEIVWCYTGPAAPRMRQFSRKHDTIFWYSVGRKWTFNYDDVRVPHADGAPHVGGFVGEGSRPLDRTTASAYGKKGKILESWWAQSKGNGLAIAARQSKQYLGYPTQKPLALLERVIKASSNRGDVVLDPFCGCGTTVVAARNLNRRFVGIDISHFAIDIVRDNRLRAPDLPVHGVPVDVDTAERMARADAFEFEKWAVTRIPGMVPNATAGSDSGIDGRGKLLDGGGLVLAQVKSGVPQVGQVRDFCHVLDREQAACGVFTTLREYSSPSANAEFARKGTLKIGASEYPRAQFWSIEEYFRRNRHPPHLPTFADPFTGKAMHPNIFDVDHGV